ncbi:MAG: sigma-70 family RNA polymerase sigma factor [Candidatus Pacebacteria bacterium]|nr:sigma-70 family RNA polymerase sigma factor [Candidatus Paceibacterota bacterium]
MKDLTTLTDEEAVEYIRTQDKESYREIMERYQNKLMRYANRLTHNETESADIVQNAFVKAFVNLNSFNTKMKFSSWIYRIVHNEAMNTFAKYKQRREIQISEDMDFESSEDIEADFTKKEERVIVEKCMSSMSLLYYEPLALFFLENKSYEEISEILRLPIGTVGTRINRAKILMKKICQTIKK